MNIRLIRHIIAVCFIVPVVIWLFLSIAPIIRFFSQMAPPRQGRYQVEIEFDSNMELIFLVRDFLVDTDHTRIFISPYMEDGMMHVTGLSPADTPIDNLEVVYAIAQLHQNGFTTIAKNYNVIRIARFSGRNVGIGVAYSINGDVPCYSAFNFLTEIEPLANDRWFYYEEDFNEYRRRAQRNH